MVINKMKLKFKRNELCPCGSGLKYKKCCIQNNNANSALIREAYSRRYGIKIKTPEEIEGIRKAGILAVETIDLVENYIKPGITTDEINTIVHNFTIKNNAIPATLGYRGYPKSLCTSVNEVICHGIPGAYVLKDGDIINIDVTPILNGYYGDANKTFFVGNPGEDAKKIVRVSANCLKLGIEAVKPGHTLGHIGYAIQSYAESQGCSVVKEFVGHGIGLNFHEPPHVMHYGRNGEGVELVPGMVFTIEPMINLGKEDLKILADNWTAVTLDSSLSAQFEQTIVVTEDGVESLTPYEL